MSIRDGSGEGRVAERRLVRHRIEAVITEARLVTVWQPIFSLSTQRVVGLEALTRFDHPVERSPADWFKDAEQVGLGPQLELAAIENALVIAEGVPEDVYVSVNASPTAVLSDGLAEACLSGPIAPNRIVVEMTEHQSVDDYNPLADRLGALRSDGLRLAIDDVGAGFASFRHILRLTPDIMKLDATIIQGIARSQGQRALAEALVHFTVETGGMTIVAEGIERLLDLMAVSSVGVDEGQGFYLGRPVGFDALDWDALTPACSVA